MQLSSGRGRRLTVHPLLTATSMTLAASLSVGSVSGADPAEEEPAKVGRAGARSTGERGPASENALEDTATKRASTEMAAYQDSDNVTVFTPSVAAAIENVSGASLHAAYLVDIVSAASVDIVSTASPRWQEVRHAAALAFDYKPQDFGFGVGGSLSSEPDYLSYGGYGRVTKDFDEKNWSLFFGFGLIRDAVGRCGGTVNVCAAFDVFSREVLRGALNWGVNLVIDPASVASLSLDVILESGDQSKPYRYVPMFSPTVAPSVPKGADIEWVNRARLQERPLEQLPLSRRRFALTARYARRMGSSTLRLMERGYSDSWGLLASSTDARFILDLGRRFAIGPHGRFHFQRPVTFWRRAYVSGPGWDLPLYRTGDRELGPLWTATGGLGATWYLGADADPKRWAIDLTLDTVYTSFLDNLYILNRTALFGALGLEATF